MRVRRLLCVIDCCRADEVRLVPDIMKDCICVVLRSSERTAVASPTAGSMFTRYFLAGLRSAVKCPCDQRVNCQLLKDFRQKSLASGVVTLKNLFRYTTQVRAINVNSAITHRYSAEGGTLSSSLYCRDSEIRYSAYILIVLLTPKRHRI